MIKNIITWQCQFLTNFDKRKTASLRTIFRNCKIKWSMQCVIPLVMRIFRDLSDSEIRFSKKNFYHRLFWKNIIFYSGFCLVSIITSRYFRKSKKSLYIVVDNRKLYHCANFGVSSSKNEKGVGISVQHIKKMHFEKIDFFKF